MRSAKLGPGAELSGLLKAQAALLCAVFGAGIESASRRGYHSLTVTWANAMTSKYHSF